MSNRSLSLVALVAGLAACGTTAGSAADATIDTSAAADTGVAGDTTTTTDAPADVDPVASPATCNPLAVTGECLPPFPSDFLTRPDTTTATGRRLALPQGALVVPAGSPALDMTPFNRADGFPTSAPIVVHLGAAVGAQALVGVRDTARSLAADAPVAVFDMASGRRVPYLAEMDATARDPARAALLIRVLAPLAFGTRHVVALRRAVRTAAGAEPPPSPGFAALRDRTPSADPRVEAARARYDEVFAFLARNGYARDDLYLAWDYTTASRAHVLGPILAMRAEVFRRADGAEGIPFEIERVEEDPNANTARIVYGTFTPPNYLRADNSIAYGPDGRPALQAESRRYPFTMVVPARARRERVPIPLVLFGHGVFGNGRDYLSGDIGTGLIQPLAEQSGGVVVATDWIGLSSGDTAILIRDVVPNINRIGLVTDRLLQSVVNNLALVELARGALQRDARVRFEGAALLDLARTYYYGVSLGGIQGASLVSSSRHITRAVISVPGGSWSNILPRSIVYAPIQMFVNQRYPDPLLQAEFMTLLQARFDHTDGVNLGTMFQRDPPPDAPRDRRIVIQEAMGDCQVPNLTTDILARALGLRQLTPAVEPVFGLDPVATPAEHSVVAQYALTTNLRRYAPPEGNLVPSMDNNTHSDSVALPQALRQVRDLFVSGAVVQHCAEACDPD